MRNFIFALLIISSLSAFSSETINSSSFESTVKFKIPTLDNKTLLTGQIDLPNSNSYFDTVVIMIPGTGLFDRDVDFGTTGTEDDLIFKKISQKAVNENIAIVRFDYRGIRCSFKTMPVCLDCNSLMDRLESYKKSCIDNKVRAEVTPENIQEDIASIYKFSKENALLKNKKIIIFAHSEGSFHVSKLISDNKISPEKIVFMGGIAESVSSVIHWQSVGRLFDLLFSLDLNKNDLLTNEEIFMGQPTKPLLSLHPANAFNSPNGFWSRESLLEFFSNNYDQLKKEILNVSDKTPFISGGITMASFRWWKMFFNEQGDVVQNLINFNGAVIYHNGDADDQVNFLRQQRIVNEFQSKNQNISIVRHFGLGHSLGKNSIFGPIDNQSLNLIIQSFKDVNINNY